MQCFRVQISELETVHLLLLLNIQRIACGKQDLGSLTPPGFDNALDPCCGGSFPPFLCIGIANSSSSLCSDRSKYVFWDAFHPTEAANLIVAGKLLDGDAAAAFPINVRELFQYDHK